MNLITNFLLFAQQVLGSLFSPFLSGYDWILHGEGLFNSVVTGLLIYVAFRFAWSYTNGASARLRVALKEHKKINSLEMIARNFVARLWTYFAMGWMLMGLIFAAWVFQRYYGEIAIVISSYVIGGAAILATLIAVFSGVMLTSGDDFTRLGEGDEVYDCVHALCKSAGVKTPKVYRRENIPQPNAYFCGIFGSGGVVIHSGFMDRHWTKEDRQMVLAHELGHYLNRDIFLTVFAITMVLSIQWIGKIITNLGLYVGGFGGEKKEGSSSSGKAILVALVVMLVGYAISILLVAITGLAKLAVSRQREYLADRMAIALTGKPRAMADMLKKLQNAPKVPARSGITGQLESALFINQAYSEVLSLAMNAQQSNKPGKDFLRWFSEVGSTHPPTRKRVDQALELVPGQ